MSENTLYISDSSVAAAGGSQLTLGLDDLILTQDMATSAGSKMLAGFKSLFDARVYERLREAGCAIAGKVNIGEFGIDFLGETSHFGPVLTAEGQLTTAASQLLASGSLDAVVGLDVNGAQARAAALAGQVHLKPTYGCVSRYGTMAVACSGETVDVSACSTEMVQQVLDMLAGHDDADGTSLPENECARLKSGSSEAAPITQVKVARGLVNTADEATQQLIEATIETLKAEGIAVSDAAPETDKLLSVANLAWNILMCAELCNNVNRFEGMKYGYHAEKCQSIDELYTKSRTEAFGSLIKTAILYGSEVLATNNYDRCYDKALRIRRMVLQVLSEECAGGAALLLPTCAKRAYSLSDVEANPNLAFEENRFTAPAAITGLPALVAGGVQLVGDAFSETALLRLGAALSSANLAGKEA